MVWHQDPKLQTVNWPDSKRKRWRWRPTESSCAAARGRAAAIRLFLLLYHFPSHFMQKQRLYHKVMECHMLSGWEPLLGFAPDARRNLNWLRRAESRQVLTTGPHPTKQRYTHAGQRHLTMESISVGWLECLWASRMANTAFQPGSAGLLASTSAVPFSLVSLASVIFSQGHQSLCWEVGSKKLRGEVSWGRKERHSLIRVDDGSGQGGAAAT